MSTLRNAVKRKEHKERAQPAARHRFGLLEKHKDYVERAKDYHRKEDHLQLLREKASFRNPDEFYFAMEKSGTKGGVHVVDRKRRYKEAELRDMRNADVRYVRLRSQVESKRIDRLRASLQSSGSAAEATAGGDDDGHRGRRHTKFDDDGTAAADDDGQGGDGSAPTLRVTKKNRRLATELTLRAKRLDHMRSLEKRLEMQNQNSRKGNTRRRQRLK